MMNATMADKRKSDSRRDGKKAVGTATGEVEKGSQEEAPQPEELTPEAALADARAAAEVANDKYLRAKAELDNYRKRAQRDLTEARDYMKGVTLQEFFSPFDHFRMAMAHVEETPDVETMKQGMNMILGEFRKSFENLGVELVDATGQKFDPEQHEAVAQEASDDIPPGTVIRQWKCGYRMGDKLLRPATVVVSSGPAAEEEAGEQADG